MNCMMFKFSAFKRERVYERLYNWTVYKENHMLKNIFSNNWISNKNNENILWNRHYDGNFYNIQKKTYRFFNVFSQ